MPQQAVYNMIERSPLMERIEQRIKESGLSLHEEAERLWDKAKEIVERQYDIDDGNEGFYPSVMGIYKRMVGLSNAEDFDEGEVTKLTRLKIKIELEVRSQDCI
jgi:TPP-dependent pyruvate/acetoin dehydrogenase alpha subunit